MRRVNLHWLRVPAFVGWVKEPILHCVRVQVELGAGQGGCGLYLVWGGRR